MRQPTAQRPDRALLRPRLAARPAGARDSDDAAAARAANRFDIRRIIGALFALYGVALTLVGLVGAHHLKVKASGIDIDLWTGLGMLVVAALMIAWALLRPARPDSRATRRSASGQTLSGPAT